MKERILLPLINCIQIALDFIQHSFASIYIPTAYQSAMNGGNLHTPEKVFGSAFLIWALSWAFGVADVNGAYGTWCSCLIMFFSSFFYTHTCGSPTLTNVHERHDHYAG